MPIFKRQPLQVKERRFLTNNQIYTPLPDLIEIYRAFLAENPYNVAFQKGLMEAQKLSTATAANVPAQTPVAVPLDAPPVVQLGENEILCPHCNQVNLKTDYYCQHCGQAIQEP